MEKIVAGIVAVLLFTSMSFGCEGLFSENLDCAKVLLEKPESFAKGTELYYLSWIEHGEFTNKASAARHLLEMSNRSEFEATEKIYKCQESQVIRNMMIIALFDLQPDKYDSLAVRLLDEGDRSQSDLQGTWVKAGNDFDGENVDFYFDWGGKAAVRLIRKGFYSRRARQIILELAQEYYVTRRAEAATALLLFEGLPPVDLTVQRERFDGPSPVAERLKEIERWFNKNESKLRWNPETKTYQIK